MKILFALLTVVIAAFAMAQTYAVAQLETDLKKCRSNESSGNIRIKACKNVLASQHSKDLDMLEANKVLAALFFLRADFKSSVQYYSEAIALTPDDASLLVGRSMAWFFQLDYKKSLDDIDAVLKQDRGNARFIAHRGVCLMFMGQTEAAIHDFSDALSIDPTLTQVRQFRAMLAVQSGSYSSALEDWRIVVQEAPEDALGYASIAQLLAVGPMSLRDEGKALEYARLAVELDNSTGSHNALAIALASSGYLEQSISIFKKVSKLDPDKYLYVQRYLERYGYLSGYTEGEFSALEESAIRRCFQDNCNFLLD